MKRRGWRGLVKRAAFFMVAGLVSLSAGGADFMAQRRQFREEIKNKVESKLDAKGNYLAVIFKSESNKYNFKMTAEDRGRLKSHLKTYFSCSDNALLEKMLSELEGGRYIVFKEFHSDGVNLKTVFLSPKAKYWEWLTDHNGIEKMFHVYNFSVGTYAPDGDSMFVVLQTEGTFYGITQAVSVPVFFRRNFADRTYNFRIATQAEMINAVNKMPALKPTRTRPAEKFIDACRTHPYFQQKKGNEFLVTDKQILDLYDMVVTNKDARCPVKESNGRWQVFEDYPYLVVNYTLKTRVNIAALIPDSLKFMAGAVDEVAQSISDEVSVKYLPLSMKNFRDFTQEWTRAGGPK